MEAQTLPDINTKMIIITRAVYQTVSYFDIFKYPLKAEEIKKYCSQKIDANELTLAITELLSRNKIVNEGPYYFLKDSDNACVRTRIDNEVFLTRKLSRITGFAKLVNGFPFVEAAFISGSVSKGVLNQDGDVDYFIVSKPGRVWICRTLLIAFKKIVLFNSRKYFCVNYFIDTDHLKVPDNNLFVATEIKTLIPVIKNAVTEKFFAENEWTNQLFPNFKEEILPLSQNKGSKPWISRIIESFGSGSLGEKADNYLFKTTLKRWQKKFPHFNKNEFDLNMRSYKNVSKHHPQGNQNKVLTALQERMNKYE